MCTDSLTVLCFTWFQKVPLRRSWVNGQLTVVICGDFCQIFPWKLRYFATHPEMVQLPNCRCKWPASVCRICQPGATESLAVTDAVPLFLAAADIKDIVSTCSTSYQQPKTPCHWTETVSHCMVFQDPAMQEFVEFDPVPNSEWKWRVRVWYAAVLPWFASEGENILGRNTAFFENQERRTENFARSLCCPLVCRNVLLPQVFRMARSTYTESALLRSW